MKSFIGQITERHEFLHADEGRFVIRDAGDGVVEMVDGGVVHTTLKVDDGVLTVVSGHPLQVTKGSRKVKVPSPSMERAPLVVEDMPFRVSGEGYSVWFRFDPYGLPALAAMVESFAAILTRVYSYPAFPVAGAMLLVLGVASFQIGEKGADTARDTVQTVVSRFEAQGQEATP